MTAPAAHVVVIGGAHGLGLSIARAWTERGAQVTVTSRDQARAEDAANRIGGAGATGRVCDLNDDSSVQTLFGSVRRVDHLIITAVDRDFSTAADYDAGASARALEMKTVGYTNAVHHALPSFDENGSVVLFSGLSMWRPLPGSTTLSMANAAVIGLTRSLAVQIAPIRVNAITPGLVDTDDDDVDEFRRAALQVVAERTPGKRVPTAADIVAAAFALTDNPGINGENLVIDGGYRLV